MSPNWTTFQNEFQFNYGGNELDLWERHKFRNNEDGYPILNAEGKHIYRERDGFFPDKSLFPYQYYMFYNGIHYNYLSEKENILAEKTDSGGGLIKNKKPKNQRTNKKNKKNRKKSKNQRTNKKLRRK